MKNSIILMLGFLMALGACKKDRPELDPPGSKLDGINASWTLHEVQVVDVASLTESRVEVTDAFANGNGMSMEFNSTDFTYAVTPGNSPAYFGTSGSWAFDDNEYPTKITLTTSEAKTIVLPLVRTIRPSDQFLNFAFNRTCNGEEDAYIGYEFKFVRSN